MPAARFPLLFLLTLWIWGSSQMLVTAFLTRLTVYTLLVWSQLRLTVQQLALAAHTSASRAVLPHSSSPSWDQA